MEGVRGVGKRRLCEVGVRGGGWVEGVRGGGCER